MNLNPPSVLGWRNSNYKGFIWVHTFTSQRFVKGLIDTTCHKPPLFSFFCFSWRHSDRSVCCVGPRAEFYVRPGGSDSPRWWVHGDDLSGRLHSRLLFAAFSSSSVGKQTALFLSLLSVSELDGLINHVTVTHVSLKFICLTKRMWRRKKNKTTLSLLPNTLRCLHTSVMPCGCEWRSRGHLVSSSLHVVWPLHQINEQVSSKNTSQKLKRPELNEKQIQS